MANSTSRSAQPTCPRRCPARLRYAELVSQGQRAAAQQVLEGLNPLARKALATGGEAEAVVEQLAQALRERGHAVDRQIGQSGQSVNPQILLALGISGAPQHLNYIGTRATILAFNRDPEAPLLTLNRRQPQPRVYPIVGDLFETVPAFIAVVELITNIANTAREIASLRRLIN